MIEGVFLIKGPKLDDVYFVINTTLPSVDQKYFQRVCEIVRNNFPDFSAFLDGLREYGFHIIRQNDFNGSYDWNENASWA